MADERELPKGLIRLEPNQKEEKAVEVDQKEHEVGNSSKQSKAVETERKKKNQTASSAAELLKRAEAKRRKAKDTHDPSIDSKNSEAAFSNGTKKITRIQAQKKKGRYNIYLNGEYAFPVDEALIVKHYLRKGMVVSSELEQTLKEEDTFRKAYQRALNYLSYGLRSEKEVRDDLAEKEFEEYADAVIDKLKDQRLIDDVEYAKAYVRTAANLNRKGPRVIANELKRRGINELKIEEALPEYSEEDQVDNAVTLAEKQWKKAKKKSEREAIQYVRQFLMQKGFQADVINVALETIDTDKEEDEEYEALVKQAEKAWKRYARKVDGYDLEQKIKAYLFQKGYPSELIQRFIDSKSE
jgi:regulatory protein